MGARNTNRGSEFLPHWVKRLRAVGGMHPGKAAALRYLSWRESHHLKPVRAFELPHPDDIVCIVVVRNEAARLPDFLHHYRSLGVARFAIVDDGSSDESVPFLLEQPDVDLFRSPHSFVEARRGAFWRTALAARYGKRRWYVVVDADEHLVFDGCENHDLNALAHHLEAAGRASMPAMMLDMYGPGPIHATHMPDSGRLLDACPMFDGRGYAIRESGPGARFIDYTGGPRLRVFAGDGAESFSLIAKTPFIKWSPSAAWVTCHVVYPLALNFGEPRGALLHYKFLSDFHDRAVTAVKEGNFFNNSWEYRVYLERLEQDPDLTLTDEHSRRFENSGTLVDAGLASPIDWS